jgi:hypothetical protein
MAGGPDEFVEKIAQNLPQTHFLSKLINNVYLAKSSQNFGYFCNLNKPAQSTITQKADIRSIGSPC